MRGHVVNSVTGQGYDNEIQYSFDTEKGLLPVVYRNTFKYPERTSTSTVNLQWAKYGSAWYVSRAEYRVQPKTNKQKVITIKKFSPNVDVAQDEFKLTSIGISDGTEVVDKVAGITYLYGASTALLEDLERPLEEAEFVQSIEEQDPELVSQTTDANVSKERTDRSQANIKEVDSASSKMAVQADARSSWTKRILVTCIIFIVGIVVFFAYGRVKRHT
jgi:t-SNARE complex subunit (syntaxin)